MISFINHRGIDEGTSRGLTAIYVRIYIKGEKKEMKKSVKCDNSICNLQNM